MSLGKMPHRLARLAGARSSWGRALALHGPRVPGPMGAGRRGRGAAATAAAHRLRRDFAAHAPPTGGEHAEAGLGPRLTQLAHLAAALAAAAAAAHPHVAAAAAAASRAPAAGGAGRADAGQASAGGASADQAPDGAGAAAAAPGDTAHPAGQAAGDTAAGEPAAGDAPAGPAPAEDRTAAADGTDAPAAGGAAGGARLSDGYTAGQLVADMQRLQAADRREGGPRRSPAQLRGIAEGIVAGVNAYFPAATYGSPTQMARALVASAWKESKFDPSRGNGGVFQCAGNRLADYNRAHGTNLSARALATTGDPRRAIDISLWAMAHPDRHVIGRAVGGTPIPSSPRDAIIYYWNYNGARTANAGGRTEIADYMDKLRYFQALVAR